MEPAYGESIYRTRRVLEEIGNACPQARNCVSLRAPQALLDAGASKSIELQCPAELPHLWGWDAQRHEHIAVRVVSFKPNGTGLRLIAWNRADAPGAVTVHVGCSGKPFHGTSFMQELRAMPTNVTVPRGNR